MVKRICAECLEETGEMLSCPHCRYPETTMVAEIDPDLADLLDRHKVVSSTICWCGWFASPGEVAITTFEHIAEVLDEHGYSKCG